MRYQWKTCVLGLGIALAATAAVANHHEGEAKPAEAAAEQAMDQAVDQAVDQAKGMAEEAAAEQVDAMAAEAEEAMGQGEAQGGAAMADMPPEMQAMMEAWMKAGTPGEQHSRMASEAGDYTATVKMWMGPGEPSVSTAKASRKMILDGRVLAEHFEGDMDGMPFVGHGMFGYDNAAGEFWSTWNDSMSTGIMVSRGTWDEEKQELRMKGTMTDAMSGQPMTLEMVTRHTEAGEVFEMWEPHGEGGEMVKTMEITYVKN